MTAYLEELGHWFLEQYCCLLVFFVLLVDRVSCWVIRFVGSSRLVRVDYCFKSSYHFTMVIVRFIVKD